MLAKTSVKKRKAPPTREMYRKNYTKGKKCAPCVGCFTEWCLQKWAFLGETVSLPGVLTFTVFPPPLPGCSRRHSCGSCNVDESIRMSSPHFLFFSLLRPVLTQVSVLFSNFYHFILFFKGNLELLLFNMYENENH